MINFVYSEESWCSVIVATRTQIIIAKNIANPSIQETTGFGAVLTDIIIETVIAIRNIFVEKRLRLLINERKKAKIYIIYRRKEINFFWQELLCQ